MDKRKFPTYYKIKQIRKNLKDDVTSFNNIGKMKPAIEIKEDGMDFTSTLNPPTEFEIRPEILQLAKFKTNLQKEY